MKPRAATFREEAFTTDQAILWRRLDGPGHDACRLRSAGSGFRLEGSAVFGSEGRPARLDYAVFCDAGWRTERGTVKGFAGSRSIDLEIELTAAGDWFQNGRAISGLEGLIDLDLGFTPATNLLPLRRLALAEGAAAEAPVAWLDVDASTLQSVRQSYERRAAGTYWYESPQFNYAALLEVDETGFVRSYPGLWIAEAL